MSATNLTGNIYGNRQGSVDVTHTYPIAFNTTGIGSSILVDRIQASAQRPVQVEVSCNVTAIFNAGTTNVLTVGTSTAATEWFGTGDIDETATGYYPASNAVKKFRLTSDTPVYIKYTQSGTPGSAGKAVVIIREYAENSAPIA